MINVNGSYAAELEQIASRLINPEPQAVGTACGFDRFADTLRSKRIEALQRDLQFAIANDKRVATWIPDYVSAVPPAASERRLDDARRLVHWLKARLPQDILLHDVLDCQLAHFDVVERAQQKSFEYRSFQQWAIVAEFDDDARIQANPARSVATLRTDRLVVAEGPLPTKVVFFARGRQICAGLFTHEVRQVLMRVTGKDAVTLRKLRRESAKHSATVQSMITSRLIGFCPSTGAATSAIFGN